jgi:hypothetical protein
MTERTSAKASRTPGSLPPEEVEDRGNVGTATPGDYPKAERGDGDVTGKANRGGKASGHIARPDGTDPGNVRSPR